MVLQPADRDHALRQLRQANGLFVVQINSAGPVCSGCGRPFVVGERALFVWDAKGSRIRHEGEAK